ncbi:MAG: DNA-processing protein DprA [Pseudomonadota bacterium]
MWEQSKIERRPGGLTDQERHDWLRLARTPRVGPVTFFQLIARFGDAKTALNAFPNLSTGQRATKPPSPAVVDRELKSSAALGATVLCAIEDDFPPLLKHFSHPPPVLTCLGNIQLTQRRCIAIVGARQASAAGRKLARDIARDLSKAGFVIASGLGRGIDGEAHAASLSGGTIAVLGGGIDHIYPPQHERLHGEIAKHGLLISESPFGHRATARDFPRRNRIITGLAEGVVVIEAAERSGSLISARTALEQNREVMSVPGSPLDPRSAGTNRLLREGATLVRHADDIIEALSRSAIPPVESPPSPQYNLGIESEADIPESQLEQVQSVLGPTPISISEIARVCQLSPSRCAVILVELELAGLARTYAGGLASIAL